jgi:hypothetical protein
MPLRRTAKGHTRMLTAPIRGPIVSWRMSDRRCGAYLEVGLAAALSLGLGGCRRQPAACPEGLGMVSDRSVAGHSVLCRSGDGKTAQWIEFHQGSDRRQVCIFAGGVPSGPFVSFHPGGKRWVQGAYRGGVKEGKWDQWNAAGSKVAEAEYRGGHLVAGAPVGMIARCETVKP